VPDYTTLPDHDWEGATYYPLTERQAARASQHLEGQVKIKVEDEVTLRVVEVVCRQCRRVYEDAHDEPCVIGIHLRGGPIGERKKRKGVAVEGGDAYYPTDIDGDEPIYRDLARTMRGPV
jgi:hypothetical protein